MARVAAQAAAARAARRANDIDGVKRVGTGILNQVPDLPPDRERLPDGT